MGVEKKLRDAIERSGLTRYAIAKGAGITYEVLMRFLDERRDIRLSTVEKLAAFFELDLMPKKKPTTGRRSKSRGA
ncbi:MAG: hypothetical protein B7Z73_05500 [Planctomycetia bacterium 21-64-5]|nr:MAG: hypothetical protein B7Z73_05500 [Planctomycetia bacterium 21-64-5]HQU42132.1 helix-turn-helix transcriptional regulator [Pirellulales bacterium]